MADHSIILRQDVPFVVERGCSRTRPAGAGAPSAPRASTARRCRTRPSQTPSGVADAAKIDQAAKNPFVYLSLIQEFPPGLIKFQNLESLLK